MPVTHAYPKDLADHVINAWDSINAPEPLEGLNIFASLPKRRILESIISCCYQASLLREEDRMLTFRIILQDSNQLPAQDGPPTGLHRLILAEPSPLTVDELRKLSTAANFHRSLIGVHVDSDGNPQVWGIVHCGPRWLHSIHGGRGFVPPLPPVPVINVTGPGQVEVCKGLVSVGQLREGKVIGSSMNVFESKWLQETFSSIRSERLALHAAAAEKSNLLYAKLDPDLTRVIDQNMLKRMIAAMRGFHHGATLILIPPERAEYVFHKNSSLSLKYRFANEEPRARFRTLILSMMNTLAQSGPANSLKQDLLGWHDYAESKDPAIANLDEAIFEMSNLIAALSTVDGAVVLTKRFELLGFAAEIHSDLTSLNTVARATDLEGNNFKIESVNGVGTRHRSAYALCQDLKDSLVIVISQDGGVRFVAWKDNKVMYWEHQSTFAFASQF